MPAASNRERHHWLLCWWERKFTNLQDQMGNNLNTNYEEKAEIAKINVSAFIQKKTRKITTTSLSVMSTPSLLVTVEFWLLRSICFSQKKTKNYPAATRLKTFSIPECTFLSFFSFLQQRQEHRHQRWILLKSSWHTTPWAARNHAPRVWTRYQRTQTEVKCTNLHWSPTWGVNRGRWGPQIALSYWHKKPVGDKQRPVRYSQQED